MKILFICGAYPLEQNPHFIKNCRGKSHIQNAPNVFQWSVIKGLMDNYADVDVVTLPFLPSFPMRYSDFYTPNSDVLFEGRKIGRMLAYCNLMGYKTISIKNRLQKYLMKWIKQNYLEHESIVLLTYTPYAPFIKALINVRKKYPRVTTASIVTDLVDDMMAFKSNRKPLKRLQCWLEKRDTVKGYKHIDKYVLLSKYMQDKIPESVGRNIVMEGIYSSTEENLSVIKSSELKTVLYTGTLEEFAGVVALLKAFMLLKEPNFRLIICGSGSCSSFVEECVKKDERVSFRGLIDRNEVLKLQKEATLLINPRKPNGEITRYSFPSKTMEYLASGTPMLGYKLEGIPSEYYKYYFIIDDHSLQGLSSRLRDVLLLPQSSLDEMATSARSFILKNKNAKKQMERVLNFLQ